MTRNSDTVRIKGITIGGDSPILVQTMCNTHTQEIETSVNQCLSVAKAGAKLIRLTTQGLKEVEALKEIKKRLIKANCYVPLVADVHFTSDVAIAAAAVADKVRINPGNFTKDHDEAKSQFTKFIEVCKQHDTAIRIGLNHGSLGERITNLYGNTPLGMKEAAMEWIEMALALDFHNVVVSLKASNTIVMVSAYRLLHKAMNKRNIHFPIHLGVTEAGNGDEARIKSAVGIGTLLNEEIGDTIRVSLTENPINEIIAGNIITDHYCHNYDAGSNCMKISQAEKNRAKIETQLRHGIVIPELHYEINSWEEFIIKASCDFGHYLLDKQIDDFKVTCNIKYPDTKIRDFKENLMQAARRKFTKPEYIACPGCGRTLYNLEETFNEVKRRTAELRGVKIAVMGCIVNGPGEMADADFGYVGEGAGKVAIYKGSTALLHGVPQEEAIDKLIEIIRLSYPASEINSVKYNGTEKSITIP